MTGLSKSKVAQASQLSKGWLIFPSSASAIIA